VVEARWHQSSEDHIARHGVTWTDVEEALVGPVVIRLAQGDVRQILGRTIGGRPLAIYVVPDDDASSVYVVTARQMTSAELRTYRRRWQKG
jgi:uncharacterized protein